MRKCILSPLCSAFVVPGLGQIINHQLKKGLILLSIIFVLFVGGTIELVFMILSIMNQGRVAPSEPGDLVKSFQGDSLTTLWLFIIPFAVVWVYSVLDAFWAGRRLDKQEGEAS